MSFTIVRQDITRLKVDAIVNAGNNNLLQGGGVCGAIFTAAGAADLQMACNPLAPIKTGQAVMTPGFALPSRFIIHTAGPIYANYSPEESARLLGQCYTNSLNLAVVKGFESIAFPLISSGIYGYPPDEALKVASNAILQFLEEQELEVYLCVFSHKAFRASRELMGQVQSFVDEHYVDSLERRDFSRLNKNTFFLMDKAKDRPQPDILNELPGLIDSAVGLASELHSRFAFEQKPVATFSEMVLSLIDQKNMTDTEVYRRANLDRRLFSKLRSDTGYQPSKNTALALAIALKLSYNETQDLLSRAGYILHPAQKADLIVEYFIRERMYDIYEINCILIELKHDPLGARVRAPEV